MNSDWRECSLGDLITIKHGFAFPGEHISKEQGKCVLVTPGNFEIGGGFKEGNAKYFHGKYPEEYVFAHGDLIVTMTDLSKTADTLGYSAKIPGEKGKIYLHNQRVGKVFSTSPEAELDYLFWVMRHRDYRSWVVNTATGSTVKHTSPSRILEYTLQLPPLGEQQAIAHILGTLDDKIELNRKTNETLEAIAKALFKSWFVDFDPVKAKAEGRPTRLPDEISDLFPDSFEDSELGEIPRGWSIATLSDISSISTGKRPLSVSNSHSGANRIPVYGGAGIMGYTCSALTAGEPILTTGRVGTLGVVNKVFKEAWISDNTLIVNPINNYFAYAYHFLVGQDLKSLNRGSTQPLLSQADLKALLLVKPTATVLSTFCVLTQPWQERQSAMLPESEAIKALLDALLPKLISGEIRIPDAERILEEMGV